MIHSIRIPKWRLAAAALLLASGATTVQAQEAQAAPVKATPAAAAKASPFVLAGRNDLEQAVTYILERIAEHRTRLDRMDNAARFFKQSGDAEKVRVVDQLRERELKALNQTLEEYHRLLGDKDFKRVISAVRERLSAGDLPADRSADAGDDDKGRTRADAYNDSRRMALERARATQRANITARMKEASSSELRRRAQAARTVTTSKPSTFGARSGARGVGSVLPGAGGMNNGRNGQPFNPYTRQRGRP